MKYIPRPSYDTDVFQLQSRYRSAMRDLRNRLNELPLDTMQRDQVEAALHDVSQIMQRLNLDMEDWAKAAFPKAVVNGINTARAALEIAGTVGLSTRFSGVNKRMLEAVMSDTQNDLLAVTQNVERRVRTAVRNVSAEVLRSNMAQGINGTRTNIRDVYSRLRQDLGASLDTGVIDAAGRRWKPDTYVEMLTRTKLMEAHIHGTMNEALERGVLYGRVSKHSATDACKNWEGKLLKLVSDAPGDFPTVDEARATRQVFHPNCAHLVLPERNPPELDDPEPVTTPLDGLTEPVRPRKADFGDNYDAWDAARERYREQKAAYNARIDAAAAAEKTLYTKYASVAELQNWAGRWGVTLHDSLNGVDPALFGPYADVTGKLFAKYPQVLETYRKVGGYYEVSFDRNATFYAGARGGFIFGGRATSYDDFSRAFLNTIPDGWNVRGNGTTQSLYSHEFGHEVHQTLRHMLDAKQTVTMEADLVSSVMGKRGISEYAGTDTSELFAEGFAEYEHGNSEFGRAFGEFLRRWLK